MDHDFRVYLLTEVRVSLPQQRTLGRLLSGRGFASVFSPPPVASNAFLVPPGNVAILAKRHFGLRRIRAEAISRREQEGRMTAAYLSHGNEVMVLVVGYGYPASHLRHDMNDSMLIQLHNWVVSLKMPVLIAGDLNVTTTTSSYLALCQTAGIWRVLPDGPSTTNRLGGIADSLPIDHVLANPRCPDLGVETKMRYDICISDHFPIEGTFRLGVHESTPSRKWPARMDVSGPVAERVDWVGGTRTYTEWSQKATKWISDTYLVPQVSKTTLTTVDKTPSPRIVSHKYRLFHRLFGLISRKERCPDENHSVSIQQVCDQLDMRNEGLLEDLKSVARQKHDEHMTEQLNGVLKSWKEKVKKWSVQTKHVFIYLRNLQPAKVLALKRVDGRMTSNPIHMNDMLEDIWRPIENWHTPRQLQECLNQLDEKYSMLLPHLPYWFDLQPIHVYNAIRSMKPTSPGPDGWTRDELACPPDEAIAESTEPYKRSDAAMLTHTLLGQFRRVPLEKKGEDAPEPGSIRPIDAYSALLRAVSSAQVSCLKQWLLEIARPSQYALRRGAQRAVASMNRHAECALSNIVEIWSVSIDMTKMFNMLSATIALQAVRFMGLHDDCCRQLSCITACCRGSWRMPGNTATPSFRRTKGLPQGMASSVALAEICVSVLLWRIHHSVRLQMIAYVDDLNFISRSRDDLCRVLQLVHEFAEDFHLVLSRTKTKLWGTRATELQEVATEWGLEVTTCLESLGVQWGLSPSSRPNYTKEKARIHEAAERMRRLAHLPVQILEKVKHPVLRMLIVARL